MPVTLRALPASGAAPLRVTFALTSTVSIASVVLDLEGRGVPTYEGPGLDGKVFVYSTPGLHFPTVIATDANGQLYTVMVPVQVHDPALLA